MPNLKWKKNKATNFALGKWSLGGGVGWIVLFWFSYGEPWLCKALKVWGLISCFSRCEVRDSDFLRTLLLLLDCGIVGDWSCSSCLRGNVLGCSGLFCLAPVLERWSREGAGEHFKELPCCGGWEGFQVGHLNSSLEKPSNTPSPCWDNAFWIGSKT